MANWLITGASELVTMAGPAPRRGKDLAALEIIRHGAVLVRDGHIAAVGPHSSVERMREARGAEKLELGGRVLLPGFVDSHTHLVFAASRAGEYEQRIGGATYEEIAAAGGGILSSIQRLRAMPAATLERQAMFWLSRMAEHGTTSVEVKSGYGLDLASETKILGVQRELARKQPLSVVSTFLGAHIVPPEYRSKPERYVRLLAEEMIPEIARAGLAEFCDVFCDRGAFTVEQARTILRAAQHCKMGVRLHAEQLARTGAAQLAVELRAASADHLEQVNASDIKALAGSPVVCTLLPGCNFHLGLQKFAPARALIAAGAIVALATDFNPGTSPTASMSMILSLACTQMGMLPSEAISAATINAAYSLRRHDRIGSIEVGKYADLCAFDVAGHREIPYYFGTNLCSLVMKRGAIIMPGRRPPGNVL